jgi:hypothetical protein
MFLIMKIRWAKGALSVLLAVMLLCGATMPVWGSIVNVYDSMIIKQPNQTPKPLLFGNSVTLSVEVYLPSNIVGEPRYQWYRGYYIMGSFNGYEKPIEGANSTTLTVCEKAPKDEDGTWNNYVSYYYFFTVEVTLEDGRVLFGESENSIVTYYMNYWQSYEYIFLWLADGLFGIGADEFFVRVFVSLICIPTVLFLPLSAVFSYLDAKNTSRIEFGLATGL